MAIYNFTYLMGGWRNGIQMLRIKINNCWASGGMVDALDSKSGIRKDVGVQVPPCPPIINFTSGRPAFIGAALRTKSGIRKDWG